MKKNGVYVHLYSYNVQFQKQSVSSTSMRFLCNVVVKLLEIL